MKVNLMEGINNYLHSFIGMRLIVSKVRDSEDGRETLIAGVINVKDFEKMGYDFIENIVVTIDRIELDDDEFIATLKEEIPLITSPYYNTNRTENIIEIPPVVELWGKDEDIFIQKRLIKNSSK